jgi:hypothetical protein
MAKHAHGSGMHVYQVASSAVNPLTFTTLSDLAVEYFTKDPMLDKDGNPIKLKRMTFIPNMPLFLVYMFLKYQLPVQVCSIPVEDNLDSIAILHPGKIKLSLRGPSGLLTSILTLTSSDEFPSKLL